MRTNTILAIVFIVMLIFVLSLPSCTTEKNYPNYQKGCKPQKQRREIKFKGFMTPRQIQVKIIQVTMVGRGKADLVCVNVKSDTFWLKYGWHTGEYHNVKIGTWLTVSYDENNCKPGEYIKANIKVSS